jgi:hypothetical protein
VFEVLLMMMTAMFTSYVCCSGRGRKQAEAEAEDEQNSIRWPNYAALAIDIIHTPYKYLPTYSRVGPVLYR